MQENLNPLRKLEFQKDSTLEVSVAPNAGACFGVVRAIKIGEQAIEKGSKDVYSFGPLIHNPMVVDSLTEKGLQIVNSTEEVAGGTVVLRSHGIQKEIENNLKDKGIKVLDATCPLVKKPQRIAASLGQKGFFLVLVGDPNHPEVKGVLSYFGRPDFLVTYDPGQLATIPAEVRRVGIIAQTTIEITVLNKIIESAKQRFEEVSVHNTICDATSIRQTEAVELARQADAMIVVGGKNSSNTNKLVKLCKSYQAATYHVEAKEEINPDWFVGKNKIGVTGGASTPQDYVDEIAEYIFDLATKGNHVH